MPSSPGCAAAIFAVVQAKGSGTGSERASAMYCPVRRCHQKSLSEIALVNSPVSSSPASATSTGRSHAASLAAVCGT